MLSLVCGRSCRIQLHVALPYKFSAIICVHFFSAWLAQSTCIWYVKENRMSRIQIGFNNISLLLVLDLFYPYLCYLRKSSINIFDWVMMTCNYNTLTTFFQTQLVLSSEIGKLLNSNASFTRTDDCDLRPRVPPLGCQKCLQWVGWPENTQLLVKSYHFLVQWID